MLNVNFHDSLVEKIIEASGSLESTTEEDAIKRIADIWDLFMLPSNPYPDDYLFGWELKNAGSFVTIGDIKAYVRENFQKHYSKLTEVG